MGQEATKQAKKGTSRVDASNSGTCSTGQMAPSRTSFKRNLERFSEVEVKSIVGVFENLAALSPQDKFIDRYTFLHYFPLDGMLADRLFTTFDADRNNAIDCEEFLGGLALCLRGTLNEKYKIIFDMFNINNDDGISPSELSVVLKSTLSAATRILHVGVKAEECSDSRMDEIDQLVDRVVKDAFIQCDVSKTGKLSLTEFTDWLERYPFILDRVFGHSCIQDKLNFSYSSLKESDQLHSEVRQAAKRPNELQSQTWMDINSQSWPDVGCKVFKGDFANASYLWSPVFPVSPSMPCARCKHAACLYQGSVYVYGGRSAGSALRDFWRYDLGANTWVQVPEAAGSNPPPSLQEHSVVTYKGKMFVFGGEFTSSHDVPLWSFDFENEKWQKISTKSQGPVNRRAHSAVVYDTSMFIFGGFLDLRGSTSELWKFEFDSCTWVQIKRCSQDWPGPRYSHSTAINQKAMFVFGGLEKLNATNELWKWNFANHKWSRIRFRGGPPPAFGHSAIQVGEGMLIFGGHSKGTLSNKLWKFDCGTKSWSSICPQGAITPPIRSHQSTLLVPLMEFLVNTLRPTSSHSAPPCTPHPDSSTTSKTSGAGNRYSATEWLTPRAADSQRSLSADSLMSAVANTTPLPSLTKSFVSFGSLDSTVLLPSEVEEGSLGSYRMSGSSNPGFSLGSANLREQAFSDTIKSSSQTNQNIVQSCKDLIDFSSDDESISNQPPVSQAKDSASRLATNPRHLMSKNENLTLEKSNCNPTNVAQQIDSNPNFVMQHRKCHNITNSGSKPLLTPAEMYRMQFTAHVKTKAQSFPRQMHVGGKENKGRPLRHGAGNCNGRSVNPNVVCLLVIGGKGSEAREIQRKSLDLWRCDIDTDQKEGEITKIVVRPPSEKETQGLTSGVPYHKLDHWPDEAELEMYQRRQTRLASASSGDCVLMDLSDTDSMDLLLNADDQYDRRRTADVAMPDVSV